MTDEDIIGSACDDPAVINAQMRVGADGKPVAPSRSELEARAARVLRSVIQGVLNDQSVSGSIGEKEYTLTLTTALTYTLPKYVGRINSPAFAGDDGQPIHVFPTIGEFRDWKSKHYTDDGTSNSALRVLYQNGRDDDHCLIIGAFPAVTSGDTIKIIYRLRYASTLTVDLLPEETHAYIDLMVANRMSGGTYAADVENARIDMRRSLQATIGARIKKKYPADVERAIQWMNAETTNVTGSSSTRYFSA